MTPKKKTPSTTRAGIYCRLSLDRTGEELGVDRQEAEARSMAKRHGWEVVKVYTDNSVSAYQRDTVRPAFRELTGDIEAERLDVLITYDTDRLARRVGDLANLLEVCERHHVRLATVTMGGMDVNSAGGKFLIQILAAAAENESAHKGERVKSANVQRAQRGLWKPTATRHYGYADDGEVIPAEAEVVREAVQRLLAGDTLYAVSQDFTARGIRGVRGGVMKGAHLRSMLLSPVVGGYSAIALQRKDFTAAEWEGLSPWERLGIVGRGQWEPIVHPDTWTALFHTLTEPGRARNKRGNQPAHLLSGIATCATCGAAMRAHKRSRSNVVDYICQTSKAGHPRQRREPVDTYVAQAVLARLRQVGAWEAAQAAETADDTPAAELMARRDGLTARLRELEDGYVAGKITLDQFTRMGDRLAAGLESVTAEITELAAGGGVQGEALAAGEPERWWAETATLEQRRELVRELVEVTVHAGRELPITEQVRLKYR